ncbi:hypothetical protein GmRootV116_31260 [Variovorax sp. V116]
MKQPAAFDFFAKLLPHLPHDGGRGLFADFDPATRQGPVAVARCPVKQRMARMKNDRGSPHLEALAVEMD